MEIIRHKTMATRVMTHNTSFARVGALPGAWLSAECTCVNLGLESCWPTTSPLTGLNRVDVDPLWDGVTVYWE
jgi:hypothetical protein